MALSVAVGSFTGNGTSQSVTSLSFQPKVVIIKADANTSAIIKTDTMASTASSPLMGGASTTTGITGLLSNGFSVGADAAVNTSAAVSYWVALGDAAGTELATGSYTGTGATQSITSLSFLPDLVSTHSTTTDAAGFKGSALTNSIGYHGQLASTTGITALNSNGFTLGADATFNASTVVYHYFAVKANGLLKTKPYAGNASATQSITGIGFQGDWVTIKDITAANTGVIALSPMPAASAMFVSAHNIAFDTLLWSSFDTDGFTVKNSSGVNATTDSYYSYDFKAGTNTTTTKHLLSLLGVGA